MVIKIDEKTIDFVAEYDIKDNNRKHDVEPLRFLRSGESGVLEVVRNQIWEIYCDRPESTMRSIGEEIGMSKSQVHRHLKLCKEMYDEWVTKNGLELHGSPAHRLEDTVQGFINKKKELEAVAKDCKDAGDVRGYANIEKLVIDVDKEIAKYKGAEPPKTVNVNMSGADITRKAMEEMFPSEFESD